MSNKIKRFSDFNINEGDFKTNEEFSFSSALSGVTNFFGEGLAPTVKRKLSEYLMSKIGIKENTTLSFIVQNVVKLIPMEDYLGIMTGKNLNAEYLSPLFAEATIEAINEKGIEPILSPVAEAVGLDVKGWLFTWIKESYQRMEKDRMGLKEKLINMYDFLGSLDVELSAKGYVDRFSGKEKEKLATKIGGQDVKDALKKGSSSTDVMGGLNKIAKLLGRDEVSTK